MKFRRKFRKDSECTASEVTAKYAAKRYDDSSAKKSGIGVFVVLMGNYKYLFGESARWRWKKIDGSLFLEVEENGQVVFHTWASNVTCVGGPQYLFRDAEWK